MQGHDGDAATGDFRVEVRGSAVAASDAVGELVAEWGRTVTFASRSVAESVASDLASRGTGDAWIQSAPGAAVDAYLVGREQVPGEPIARDGNRFTCPVSGNRYGALGETLVTAAGPDPALREWIREDLPIAAQAAADVVFEGDSRPPPVFVSEHGGDDDRSRRWVPDYRVQARLPGEDRPLREYWCEVKTGTGSLERSQERAMRAAARDRTVLLLAVDVSELPDAYAVRIRRVDAGK